VDRLCIAYSQIESFSLIFVVEFFSQRNLGLLLRICEAPLTSNIWDVEQRTLQLLTPNHRLPQILVMDLYIHFSFNSFSVSGFVGLSIKDVKSSEVNS
jgi:hypothetical protein